MSRTTPKKMPVKESPRHPRRFALFAALVGYAWYAMMWLGSRDDYGWFSGPFEPWLALIFALAVLVPAWLFRRILVSMPFGATFPSAALGVFLSAVCFQVVLIVITFVTGAEVEEFEDTTVLGKLAVSAIFAVMGAIQMVAPSGTGALSSLAMSWLAVLLLRWASGGVAPVEQPVLSASRA